MSADSVSAHTPPGRRRISGSSRGGKRLGIARVTTTTDIVLIRGLKK